jgi:hypothetical protein
MLHPGSPESGQPHPPPAQDGAQIKVSLGNHVSESMPEGERWEMDEDLPPRPRPPLARGVFGWLTCQGQLSEGRRRLLIVLSLPLFLLYVVPGLVFWLVVWLVVWVRMGYQLDQEHQARQQALPQDDEVVRRRPPDEFR